MNIGYPDTKNKLGGSPLFSKKDDKKLKIEAPHPQSGTTSFPTVESRESKVSPEELGKMAVDVVSFAIPGGGAVRTGKALGKVPSYLSKLNKKFPSGSNKMKKHYDDVSQGIKHIKKKK